MLTGSQSKLGGVIAVDIDKTLVSPPLWNQELIDLLKAKQQENPDLPIILFSSYTPTSFQQHFKANICRKQVKEYLEKQGLKIDQVLLTESNQYENLDPSIQFGNYFTQIIAPIEEILLSNNNQEYITNIFNNLIPQLIKEVKLAITNKLPQLNEVNSENAFKEYISKIVNSLMIANNAEFYNGDTDLIKKYRDEFKKMKINEIDAGTLAKNFIIAQLMMTLNSYSKRYIINHDNMLEKRQPGQASSGAEAKEMMMRHLQQQGYRNIFLIDDDMHVGELFKLDNYNKKSTIANDPLEGDELRKNVSGFRVNPPNPLVPLMNKITDLNAQINKQTIAMYRANNSVFGRLTRFFKLSTKKAMKKQATRGESIENLKNERTKLLDDIRKHKADSKTHMDSLRDALTQFVTKTLQAALPSENVQKPVISTEERSFSQPQPLSTEQKPTAPEVPSREGRRNLSVKQDSSTKHQQPVSSPHEKPPIRRSFLPTKNHNSNTAKLIEFFENKTKEKLVESQKGKSLKK